ncbi:hypothetical protein PAMP_021346 [Pampus punctatissimus]
MDLLHMIRMKSVSDTVLCNALSSLSVCQLHMILSIIGSQFFKLSKDDMTLWHIRLKADFRRESDAMWQIKKEMSNAGRSVSLNECHTLNNHTINSFPCCFQVQTLNTTGCEITRLLLAVITSSFSFLNGVAGNVTHNYDAPRLCNTHLSSLWMLQVFTTTALLPWYGVLRCGSASRSTMTYYTSSQTLQEEQSVYSLFVHGVSSLCVIQTLKELSWRLLYGVVNQTLLLLYLAVFSVHIPEHLRVFLVSIPGPNPAHWPAAPSLARSLGQRGDLEALQLPRSWLDSLSLKRALEGNSPKHLSFSRCPAFWPQVFQSLLEGGIKDATQLISLNLSGINHVLYSECRSVDDQLVAATMSRLAVTCCNLKHLNLMHTHYHHENTSGLGGDTHLCASLAKLRHLRSLTLPACALSDGVNTHHISTKNSSSSSLFLGLKKPPRMGVQNYKPDSEPSSSGDSTSGLVQLLAGCPFLETLELIGPGFVSAMPRLEPCARASVEPRGMCAWARGIGDAHLAALEAFPRLRRLTLAGLPGVLRGTGLVQLARQCRDLEVLSIANIGSLKTMNYLPALVDTLKHCTQLQEFRLEQPHLHANASFFEALSCCSRLQRFCLISRSGTFDSSAVETFMERCCHVMMCHMFMGGTLVACRTLQKALQEKFSFERPALSVVIYPLQHEDLPSVIRDIPLTLLDRITLFQSHVAQPPHLSPW